VAGFDEAVDTVEVMMPEPRSEEQALRSKFMLIFRGGAVSRPDLSPSELQAHVAKWYRWSDELARQGRARNNGTALDNPGATVRGCERVVTDGPYAESKDLVTGSLIVEAASLEDAIDVARTCPTYEFGGSVEVRPVQDLSDLTLVDERPAAVSSTELVEDLFRKEYAHLVSALTRVLGPSNIPLAEDVVHDALVSAMHAWRFRLPQDPKAWIIRAAHNRAIDIIRREQRRRSFLPELATTTALTDTIEAALAPAAEAASQLAMMFAVCDPGLNRETHVTLILRWLCGLSAKEIGQAFLVDTQTIDRRLHRGRGRLRELGRLPDVEDLPDIETRRDSVLRALYLLFSEGYHGSNPQDPVRPFLCEDALRLTELLLDAKATAHPDAHALAALFCFDSARLSTRRDEHGVFVPLEDQDRSRWDRARIERGLMHLARSATGDHMSRWHLEAGIACEHAIAPSIQKTDWDRIVGFYQVLAQQSWSPIVALNRALAVAERDGVDEGRRELIALAGEQKLSRYPFYWAARADLERRAGHHAAARDSYERAIALARSPAERVSYERRIESLEIS
jgi:RNA polymerase sigma-70 factor (ECF subfamily)